MKRNPGGCPCGDYEPCCDDPLVHSDDNDEDEWVHFVMVCDNCGAMCDCQL